MKLTLLCVGKSSEPWLSELENSYEKKISQIAPFNLKIIKGNALPRERSEEKIKDEAKQILKELKENDFVLVFDEAGKQFNSVEFSKVLIRQIEASKNIVMIIGGAFGLDSPIKERANTKVSFSAMTVNHLIARAVALEQLYRALTIWKRIPYHN